MSPTGEAGGLAVALLREAGRRRAFQFEWVLMNGMAPDDALQNRAIDIWLAVGVTAARKKQAPR
jgi:hypothetical protein